MDELEAEIDGLLGVQRKPGRGAGFGTHVSNLARSVKALRQRTKKFVPQNQADLDRRRKQVGAVLAEVQAVADALEKVVVPKA